MNCKSTRLPYRQSGAFSKIALDYIDQANELQPFFQHPPTLSGIQKAIEARKQFPTDRNTIYQVLRKQYQQVNASPQVEQNIEALLSPDTFTITTAHQNNIFSGPLYFIYKILHTIRLAEQLNTSLPGQHFVPVFYMGTEDADLQELNHIYLGAEKLEWKTNQTGAVGRMKIDKELLKLIGKMEGQLAVQPFGQEIIGIIKESYKLGEDIQTATFRFINNLFAGYGLIVLLPDERSLKKEMLPIFEDELLNQNASTIVEQTAEALEQAGYKLQVHPREINLFYLENDIRERVIARNGEYAVLNSSISFTREELLKTLKASPEKFSPNVVMRGLYQETILPNIAFIGGGGELAYWLQLKNLFLHYKVPFPVLVLRNSFLLVEKKWKERLEKLSLTIEDIFLPESELFNRIVTRDTKNEVKLNGSISELEQLYESFKKQASQVDSTLEKHVDSLRTRTVHQLQELEKKMLRAEKRKYADQQRQLHTVKEHLFPANGLQERYENISYYYSKWGKGFINQLYKNSLALEHEFVVLEEK